MADPNTLAALFGSSISGGSSNGIDDFLQTIAANNIYRQVSQPVLSARFNTETWSPWTKAGVTAAQAFLGSGLNALGQRSDAQQLAKVAQVLPSLYENPNSVGVPEGVDPDAFGQLKLNAIQQRGAQESALMGKLAQSLWGVDIAGREAEAKKLGEIRGENIGYGTGGDLKNPNSPIEKKAVELRDAFNNFEEVKNFKYVNRLSKQLINTLKDSSALSDAALTKMYVQFVEPKLATNAGETAALAASSSIPQEWKGMLAQGLDGKSKFDQAFREKLISFAKASFDAHASAYASTYDQFSKEAAMYGIDPSRISAIGPVQSFEKTTMTKPENSPPPENSNYDLAEVSKTHIFDPNLNSWVRKKK